MNPIGKRTLLRSWATQRGARRAKKLGPAFFDEPSDLCVGKCIAQDLRSGQSMNYIAHGAKANNQYALDAACRRLTLQDGLGKRRERMISLVEWSLGSPTISTRPPYSSTVSRSGTDSAV